MYLIRKMTFSNIRRGSFRAFSLSISAHKNNNKIQLKNLGSILLKGKVGQQDSESKANKHVEVVPQPKNAQTYLQDFVDVHSEDLENSSFIIGYMSKDDIKLQECLDSGRQFGGSGSGLVLRRSTAIESLPEEIDVLKTPWEEIERVYGVLKELDNDQRIHFKYKKRLSIDTKSLLAVRNKKLTDMCKFARRDQKRQLLPVELAFESIFQYNVVGFDRSFGGVPLQTGKHAFTDSKKGPQFPIEFLEDSRPFDTKIPIHKKEVNFMEDDALEETLMPHDLKPNSPEEILRMEGKPIMVDNIDDYNTLPHLLKELEAKIEDEILKLQRLLSSEITRSTMSLFQTLKELKRNEFVLVSRSPLATKYTGPTFKYALKFFDLAPFYGTLLLTRKHWKSLVKHLYKVIMLNISEQVDSLTRIKYKLPADRRAFLERTYSQVQHVIHKQLMPIFMQQRLDIPAHVNAVTYKQMEHTSFLRLYWLKKPNRGGAKKPSSLERRKALYLEIDRAPQPVER